MSSKKKRINVKHSQRSILTDTTPFELPLFFTNANLAVLAYLFEQDDSTHLLHAKYLLAKTFNQSTKPYTFKVRKDAESFRRLELAHPRSQHLMCQFYEEYEFFICNACSRSDYSLRYPSRVATHYVDPKHSVSEFNSNQAADEDPVGFKDQSKWASTYFSYRNYNLSYKFFESDEFLTLERRFSLLMKLDVSRCFDSIYTHSIEWSMRGKIFSKRHLPNKDRKTFESQFDSVIRHANWNETHGIIIGPEFSRVFAEVIMQAADLSIKDSLGDLQSQVEIRRYVDDYFVFAESKSTLDKVKAIVRNALETLNLYLNESKTQILARPFTSKLSAARTRVAEALDIFSKSADPLFGHLGEQPNTRRIEQMRINVISSLRRIAVELEVPYSQFSSFSLSVLDRHLSMAAESTRRLKPDLTAGHLSRLSWLISVIRVGQFLFAIDQRVTTSVKLARIYTTVLDLANQVNCARGPIEGQILDGLRHTGVNVATDTSDQIARINHICAVDLLMTGKRRLEASDLLSHVGYADTPEALGQLSLFQLSCLLFLSRRRHRFRRVLEAATEEIERRISRPHVRFDQDTEAAHLLTDYISCPYIDISRKVGSIQLAYKQITGTNCTKTDAEAIVASSAWISFTDWSGTSDLRAMLARKELTPAYE